MASSAPVEPTQQILIRIEGIIHIRHEKYADGTPTGIEAWRTVFASLQGEELFFKDVQVQTKEVHENKNLLPSMGEAQQRISPNSKKTRPISLIGGQPIKSPRKPSRPAASTARVRRSLSEGMLPTSDERVFREKWHLQKSQSLEKLDHDVDEPKETIQYIDLTQYLQHSFDKRSMTLSSRLMKSSFSLKKQLDTPSDHPLVTSLVFSDGRVSFLMELIDNPEIQQLLMEEEEEFLPRTILYCTSRAWGTYLIRCDSQALTSSWCRELRRAIRRRSIFVSPSELQLFLAAKAAEIAAPSSELLPEGQSEDHTSSPFERTSLERTSLERTSFEKTEAAAQTEDSSTSSPKLELKPAVSIKRGARNSGILQIDVNFIDQNSYLPQPSPQVSEDLSTARRSHCIPHHFITENLMLRLVKCKYCKKTIRDFRGARCIHCNNCYHKSCSEQEAPNCGMAHIQKALEDAKLKVKPAKAPVAFVPSPTLQRKMKTIGDDLFGVPLGQIDAADNGLPYIVVLCVNSIEKRGIESEGIYRVSGIKKDLERLRVHFAFGRPDLMNENQWPDINVIAGVFKAWLRELPDPLLTYDLFVEFTDLVDDNRTPKIVLNDLKKVLAKLPALNSRILHYIMNHLRRVADNSKINKMQPGNLAVVFGPTLLRPRQEGGMAKLPERVALIEFLIEHHDEIFGRATKPSA